MSTTIKTLNEGFNRKYLKEDKHQGEWKLQTQADRILDKVFSYLINEMQDDFIEFAKSELDMDADDLLYYCDLDVRDPDEFNESKVRRESIRKLKEDLKISPNTEYQSKSGHKLRIKEVDPYISEYDGEANLRITYDYKLKDSNEWKTSKCNHKDFFNMLQK